MILNLGLGHAIGIINLRKDILSEKWILTIESLYIVLFASRTTILMMI